MTTNIIIGCVVVAAVIGLMAGLVLSGRRTIERIARGGGATSARRIVKEQRNGR